MRYREAAAEEDTSDKFTLGQAMLYLILTGNSHLCETLGLICENGSNREDSICALM